MQPTNTKKIVCHMEVIVAGGWQLYFNKLNKDIAHSPNSHFTVLPMPPRVSLLACFSTCETSRTGVNEKTMGTNDKHSEDKNRQSQPRLPDENLNKKPNNAEKRPEKGQTECLKARKNPNFICGIAIAFKKNLNYKNMKKLHRN